MTNEQIADNFSLLSKIMDIHGENSFKVKSYSNAAFTIEKLSIELSEAAHEDIFAIKGIGDAIGKKIIDQLETGSLPLLNEYLSKTPVGIVEMLTIKGIGPKKIATIWKDLEIETVEELLYACNENRLTLYKGFGEKTQKNIKEGIEFYLSNKSHYLYQQIEGLAIQTTNQFQIAHPNRKFIITGAFRRQMETIEELEWVTNCLENELMLYLKENGFKEIQFLEKKVVCKGLGNLPLVFYLAKEDNLFALLFETSCSIDFLEAWKDKVGLLDSTVWASEEDVFKKSGVALIPAYAREFPEIIEKGLSNAIPKYIEPNEIKGIVHAHSTWSDGNNSLKDMAVAAKNAGMEYLVITDHSKSAFYAQGLSVESVVAQQVEIDALNKGFIQKGISVFKVFKGIECDILGDGSLDYDDNILDTFDVVIASIHSNLKMTEDKAMLRLMGAIKNPYTSILGHLTGRLLLGRPGYPIDHKTIIEACAKHHVAIELNAHPRRLDLDWRWIRYAIEKGVLISIDPDAHSIEGYADCRYGALVAQKGGLTASQNLSSFSLKEMEDFVIRQKKKRVMVYEL